MRRKITGEGLNRWQKPGKKAEKERKARRKRHKRLRKKLVKRRMKRHQINVDKFEHQWDACYQLLTVYEHHRIVERYSKEELMPLIDKLDQKTDMVLESLDPAIMRGRRMIIQLRKTEKPEKIAEVDEYEDRALRLLKEWKNRNLKPPKGRYADVKAKVKQMATMRGHIIALKINIGDIYEGRKDFLSDDEDYE